MSVSSVGADISNSFRWVVGILFTVIIGLGALWVHNVDNRTGLLELRQIQVLQDVAAIKQALTDLQLGQNEIKTLLHEHMDAIPTRRQ